MKTSFTYEQLLNVMYKAGNNFADLAIGEMMDIIEQKTGVFPGWDDVAPEWVVDRCFNNNILEV